MKTGTAMIEAVAVFCPECNEAFDGTRNGSTMICVMDTSGDGLRGGQAVECRVCGTKFRLPSIVSRVGR